MYLPPDPCPECSRVRCSSLFNCNCELADKEEYAFKLMRSYEDDLSTTPYPGETTSEVEMRIHDTRISIKNLENLIQQYRDQASNN